MKKCKQCEKEFEPKNELDLSDIDGFIQKPFSPEIFIDKIKKVIKK